MGHRGNPFQERQGYRQEDAAIGGLGGELLAERHEADGEKEHVGDKGKVAGRHCARLGDEDGKPCNAAERKVVCKLEEVDTGSHNQGADGQKNKILKLRFHNAGPPILFAPIVTFMYGKVNAAGRIISGSRIGMWESAHNIHHGGG